MKRSAIALAGLSLAHALPALTAVGILRERFAPALAGRGRPDHVALTFDDGPHPVATPKLLGILDRHQVRATFFLLGAEVRRNPALAAEIVAAGHEIALHGYHHRCLALRGPKATRDDLTRGRDVVAAAAGVTPQWYRPPYGVLTTAAVLSARRLGLRPVLWTDWGRDWTESATHDSVLRTITRHLRGGATLLLHDSDSHSATGSWRTTLAAVPHVIERSRRLGLAVGPLRQHLD